MSLTVVEAIDWIHSRLPFGSRPGLERVSALLEKINHPELKVPTIHIAGTNGKGSTVTYLRCMLEELGLTVGTFTSPYIETFNERIAINGVGISDEAIIELVTRYQPIVAAMDQEEAIAGITEFETLTGMAFDYFLQEKVDVAIIEVGLGGLLDSTNVVHPLLTGITTIGLDHMEILGETLAEIAAQKAGIIKAGIPVVTGNIESIPLAVIEAEAADKKAPIYRFDQEYFVDYLHPDEEWGEVFNFSNEAGKIPKLRVSMIGQHQSENAGMAIELFYQYCRLTKQNFQSKFVTKGLWQAQWPGRMERLSENPLIILDGAHNEHAVKRLVDNLQREFGNYQIKILFSAVATKEIHGMLTLLKQLPNVEIYLTTFNYPRSLELKDYANEVDEQLTIVSLWQFGLAEILENFEDNQLLLVTGSLYFISQVRELLLELGGADEKA